MEQEVEDFLAHYGVPGMKWGKRRASSNDSIGGSRPNSGGSDAPLKPKMSREKKIAIAVGVGATIAIGAAITIAVLNNQKSMSLPIQSLSTNSSMLKGKSNLIFSAAAANARDNASLPKSNSAMKGRADLIFKAAAANARDAEATPQKGIKTKLQEKAFDKAKDVAINKVKKMSLSDAQALLTTNSEPREGLLNKAKGAAMDKAKEIAINKAKDMLIEKAKEIAINKAKSMLNPASSIPTQPAVVFNPKTGLYEEVQAEPQAA